MKRLLTHSQLKHTKQAANKFLTCFIATIMAVALSLPAAGIPTLSFADEPNQGSVVVMPVDLEKSNGDSENGGSSSDQQGTSGNAPSGAASSNDSTNGNDAAGDAGNTSNGIEDNGSDASSVSDGSVSEAYMRLQRKMLLQNQEYLRKALLLSSWLLMLFLVWILKIPP